MRLLRLPNLRRSRRRQGWDRSDSVTAGLAGLALAGAGDGGRRPVHAAAAAAHARAPRGRWPDRVGQRRGAGHGRRRGRGLRDRSPQRDGPLQHPLRVPRAPSRPSASRPGRSATAGGPFRNVRVGGRHIHHFVPGILIAFAAGTTALLTDDDRLEDRLALPMGVGMGLTFDEAALLLDLRDVYWSEEGMLSVQVSLGLTAILSTAILTLRILRRGERRQEEAGEIPPVLPARPAAADHLTGRGGAGRGGALPRRSRPPGRGPARRRRGGPGRRRSR